MRVGLISDTHGKLRREIFEHFQNLAAILHAGDIGDLNIITELEALAPVHAVYGNTDGYEVLSRFEQEVQLELAGKKVVLTHGHLLGAPNPAKLRAAYPDADLVVYGHTHVPLVDTSASPIVVNPGAAGPARFNLKPSVALLELPAMRVQPIELG